MAVKTYNPAEVSVIWNGIILSGFADGTFVEVTRDADMFGKMIGADGKSIRTKSNDKSGRVTVRLLQGSDSNNLLAAAAILDENGDTGGGPLLVKDSSGLMVCAAASAWVKKMPDIQRAMGEQSSVEWVFESDAIDMFPGGH